MLALAGYATRYHKVVTYTGERVMLLPSAFERTLRSGACVELLLNHFDHQRVGSTADGRLQLFSDPRGLAFRFRIPDTDDGRYVRSMAEGKHHTSTSIGFDWYGAKKETRLIQGEATTCIADATLTEISYMHGSHAGLMKDAYGTLLDLDYTASLQDNCSGGRFLYEGAAVGVIRALQDLTNRAG